MDYLESLLIKDGGARERRSQKHAHTELAVGEVCALRVEQFLDGVRALHELLLAATRRVGGAATATAGNTRFWLVLRGGRAVVGERWRGGGGGGEQRRGHRAAGDQQPGGGGSRGLRLRARDRVVRLVCVGGIVRLHVDQRLRGGRRGLREQHAGWRRAGRQSGRLLLRRRRGASLGRRLIRQQVLKVEYGFWHQLRRRAVDRCLRNNRVLGGFRLYVFTKTSSKRALYNIEKDLIYERKLLFKIQNNLHKSRVVVAAI